MALAAIAAMRAQHEAPAHVVERRKTVANVPIVFQNSLCACESQSLGSQRCSASPSIACIKRCPPPEMDASRSDPQHASPAAVIAKRTFSSIIQCMRSPPATLENRQVQFTDPQRSSLPKQKRRRVARPVMIPSALNRKTSGKSAAGQRCTRRTRSIECAPPSNRHIIRADMQVARRTENSARGAGELTSSQDLLAIVRPCTPVIRQEVGRKVGQASEDVQNIVAAGLSKMARRKTRGANHRQCSLVLNLLEPLLQPVECLRVEDANFFSERTNIETLESGLANLEKVPKMNVVCRAQKKRSLLATTTFGKIRDFFDLPLSAPAKAEAPKMPATPSPPSPRSLQFLGSFHTGLTPPERKKRRASLDSGVLQQGGKYNSLLDVDSSWQPKGLDSFICETKAQGEMLGIWSSGGRVGATRRSIISNAADAAATRRGAVAKAALSRIPALLDQVHVHAHASDSASDDDEAPVAVVPVVVWCE